MKIRVTTAARLQAWRHTPEPAVFQGQVLDDWPEFDGILKDCVFLGCQVAPALSAWAANEKALVVPTKPGLTFDPFECSLYSPDDLYDRFDPTDPVASYAQCRDSLIYQAFKATSAQDFDDVLFQRIHDWSIGVALDEVLTGEVGKNAVGIMGSHGELRSSAYYAELAHLALDIRLAGRMVITGGGPGAMEAGNLGAYAAGFADPQAALTTALAILATTDPAVDGDWFAKGFEAKQAMGTPMSPEMSRSVAIPTWSYGYEPPNMFATDICKYFQNNVREDGLLTVCMGGIVYARGNGGTVQEIFQDACQNYYRTGGFKSAMILYGVGYWNPPAMNFNSSTDHNKDAYSLLHKLAKEADFDDFLLLTDDRKDIVPFVNSHKAKAKAKARPKKTP